ncbi:hypothetical protein TIFTF001_039645 [Ficus carica]|uniref:Uncharacterized protein n=1 Tax=Ficus carica TaxID=3494 RepID=A0AA88EA66_FICCA|nr:hypothetical protein TIFTF001_039640 [Ficus carica]GMN70605.1 hypothetical protein TIFTF001_039645 [Ficus carica]
MAKSFNSGTLEVVDISNTMAGGIPSSIGNCSGLAVLDLSGNNLSDNIPSSMGQRRSLQILHLSSNKLVGEFTPSFKNLSSLETLDLENNMFLENQFNGSIPTSLGDLKAMTEGPVPQTLASLSYLQYLNLLENNFSGKIPYNGQISTFDASSFVGNPGLCGVPLSVNCPGDKDYLDASGNVNKERRSDDSFIDQWFYLSVELGFASGILVPCFFLVIKRPWSYTYFTYVDEALETISFLRYKQAVHRRSGGHGLLRRG